MDNELESKVFLYKRFGGTDIAIMINWSYALYIYRDGMICLANTFNYAFSRLGSACPPKDGAIFHRVRGIVKQWLLAYEMLSSSSVPRRLCMRHIVGQYLGGNRTNYYFHDLYLGGVRRGLIDDIVPITPNFIYKVDGLTPNCTNGLSRRFNMEKFMVFKRAFVETNEWKVQYFKKCLEIIGDE